MEEKNILNETANIPSGVPNGSFNSLKLEKLDDRPFDLGNDSNQENPTESLSNVAPEELSSTSNSIDNSLKLIKHEDVKDDSPSESSRDSSNSSENHVVDNYDNNEPQDSTEGSSSEPSEPSGSSSHSSESDKLDFRPFDLGESEDEEEIEQAYVEIIEEVEINPFHFHVNEIPNLLLSNNNAQNDIRPSGLAEDIENDETNNPNLANQIFNIHVIDDVVIEEEDEVNLLVEFLVFVLVMRGNVLATEEEVEQWKDLSCISSELYLDQIKPVNLYNLINIFCDEIRENTDYKFPLLFILVKWVENLRRPYFEINGADIFAYTDIEETLDNELLTFPHPELLAAFNMLKIPKI